MGKVKKVLKAVGKIAIKPAIKFGKYLKKVNKDVNSMYKHGARP